MYEWIPDKKKTDIIISVCACLFKGGVVFFVIKSKFKNKWITILILIENFYLSFIFFQIDFTRLTFDVIVFMSPRTKEFNNLSGLQIHIRNFAQLKFN